ncbi:SDR family NAD(P)-dependent oxidoreductase [Thorsellia anophelis]|uniref:3-oxoacyl-[acyl-carrier protein] reductase n=1 Tax=Thorsellia anophelis DSM 18579 TaxID=1123402 RepID=A0A1H9ZDT7_9GAMM|nr:SDR family NAD(P)-dependent oxidoreductase [Thorsellia anophelis]SES79702.1 3-oxoacyl-[acyl-carrier protein] reductase [Thorsellia anophelis DSM 18579]
MSFNFTGKTVVVTGAAQGIGQAIAYAFAKHGASVFVCDIDENLLQETVKKCGGTTQGRQVDVTNQQAVKAFIQEVGSVDILVNCAGGVRGQEGKPIESITVDEWRALFEVNTDSTFWCSQAVAPLMKEKGFGRIINISSGAGLGISLTGIQAYASSKAAQIGLTRQLAHELGPYGITVNSIAPGFVRSNPSSEKQWQKFGEEKQKQILDSIAMRRLGKAEDIANGVLFFASDASSWITGQILSIDGGK